MKASAPNQAPLMSPSDSPPVPSTTPYLSHPGRQREGLCQKSNVPDDPFRQPPSALYKPYLSHPVTTGC
eukprot:5501915-Pyramimonas_sp.AAC.2